MPLVTVVLCGCGGSSAPAELPEPAQSERQSAPKAATEADSPPVESSAPQAPVPATAEDIRAVLQAVLDDESLQEYLGLSEPGRLPFKVYAEDLPKDLQLIKGPDPVEIVAKPKDKSEPVLVITELEVDSEKASVRFRYDVAKLRGSATLEKRDYGWELMNSHQSQR